jgi:hypothetical protein
MLRTMRRNLTLLLSLLIAISFLTARVVSAQSAGPGTSGVVDVAQFITAAGTAALMTKMVVDGIRAAVALPSLITLIMVFSIAVGSQFLLVMASGGSFTKQSFAQNVVIGLFAFGTAIGSTELAKRAEETKKNAA